MVQNTPPRPRGRPRAYDPAQALARARDAFWLAGFAATSLDDLSAATGMNRPSLYAAFGDKHRLYLDLLDRYTAAADAAIREEFAREQPLAKALTRFYRHALALYLPEDRAARGCFLIGTALSEAAADAQVRERLRAALDGFARALEQRLKRARTEGELSRDADPAALASLASAVLHSLAVRARAGDSRTALNALVKSAVKLICGGA
jgi:AcrR family transcriptional regulator